MQVGEAIALGEIEVAKVIHGMTVDVNTGNRGMRAVRLGQDDYKHPEALSLQVQIRF